MSLSRFVVLASLFVCYGSVVGAQSPLGYAGATSGARALVLDQQPKRISLELKDVPLRDALAAIASKTGLAVSLSGAKVPVDRKVTVILKDVTAEQAFTAVLEGVGFRPRFSADGQTVFVVSVKGGEKQATQQTTGSINGQVLDSTNGNGVKGVLVTLQGTKRSAITGSKGEFQIANVLTGDHSLTFKLLGYATTSRTVQVDEKKATSMRVMLRPAAATLTEVVTTVTGEQRKLEIGNAIASINVDSVMKTAPVRTLTDLLENRVPGLVVQRSSGQPGDPSRLRLRGSSSVYNSNDMVVVLDGIRIDGNATPFAATSIGMDGVNNGNIGTNRYLASSAFDQIDPNSIETLDVFKGPSAAAMYGSDAANGVLVITTKRGRAGPARWSATVDQGLSYIPGKYPIGSYRFGSLLGTVPGRCGVTDGIPLYACDVDSIVAFQALNDPYYTVLGRGATRAQSLSLSGGSQSLQYSLIGSGSADHGVLKMSRYLTDRYHELYGNTLPSWMARPDQYNTWGGTGQLATQINPDLRIQLTSKLYNSAQRKSALGNTAISVWSRKFRGDTPTDFEDRFYERMIHNQVRYTNTVNMSWQIRSWLPVTATAGIDAVSVKDEAYLPRGIIRSASDGDTIGQYSIAHGASQTRSFTVNTRVPMLGEKLTTSFGLNLQDQNGEGLSAVVRGLPAGTTIPSSGFTSTSYRSTSLTTLGWFVEPRINLRSRFFVMPGFRIDNNGFQGKRAGALGLPKMNFSWIASEEEYFPWKNFMDLMRLRMAFGTAGTQPGPKDRLRLFAVDTTVNISTDYRFNTTLSTIGNTQLRPERGVEFEGGFDAELLHGRFGIEFTEYRKVAHDAIVDVPLAPSIAQGTGNQSYKANVGVVRNSGRELSLRLTIMESSKYGWQSTFGMAQNENRVERLNVRGVPLIIGEDLSTNGGSVRRVVPGYALWGIWARPIVGVNDLNGDGHIVEREVTIADSSVYIGQPEPKGTMNLFNNWTLFSGRLTINTGMSYVYGITQTADVMRDPNSPFNLIANESSATLMQQAIAVSARRTAFGITQVVNTWRFETLSMSLNLGQGIAKKFGAKNMSVSLQGKNLGMKSNYMGKDPNVNSALMGSGSTIDIGLLSQPRVWTMRVLLGN